MAARRHDSSPIEEDDQVNPFSDLEQKKKKLHDKKAKLKKREKDLKQKEKELDDKKVELKKREEDLKQKEKELHDKEEELKKREEFKNTVEGAEAGTISKKRKRVTNERSPMIMDVDSHTSRHVTVGGLNISKGAAALEKILWDHFSECGTIVCITIGKEYKTKSLTGLAYIAFYTNAAVLLAKALDSRGIYSILSSLDLKPSPKKSTTGDSSSSKRRISLKPSGTKIRFDDSE